MTAMVVLIEVRRWVCPHCHAVHLMDHDLDDLCNLECNNCDRVTLGRLVTP
jgi:predicted  nucleic acid-binding Zn ribbon protein